MSLRGAVGSIERTQEPFATWLRESTLSLPFFVLAVIGALTLAARQFGPVLRRPRTVVATALLIVAAGTLVGIAELAASSAYDYHLQSSQLQLMGSMGGTSWARWAGGPATAGVAGLGRGTPWATAPGYSWSPTSSSSAGSWPSAAAG